MTVPVKLPRRKPTPLDKATPETFFKDMKALLGANPDAVNPQDVYGSCIYDTDRANLGGLDLLPTQVKNCAIGGFMVWAGMETPTYNEGVDSQMLGLTPGNPVVRIAQRIQNLADGGGQGLLLGSEEPTIKTNTIEDDEGRPRTVPRPWKQVLDLINEHEDWFLGKTKEDEDKED